MLEYKPNFGGAAAILQAAAQVIAVAEKERLERVLTDQRGRGHAQRLREVAAMLRGSKQDLELDAAYDCDRAAEWIEAAVSGVSLSYRQTQPPSDADQSSPTQGRDSKETDHG